MSEGPTAATARAQTLAPGRRKIRERQAAVAVGALALGAVAFAALAVGVIAIGKLAVGQLALGRARLRGGQVDELRIAKLIIEEARVERLQGPEQASGPSNEP